MWSAQDVVIIVMSYENCMSVIFLPCTPAKRWRERIQRGNSQQTSRTLPPTPPLANLTLDDVHLLPVLGIPHANCGVIAR